MTRCPECAHDWDSHTEYAAHTGEAIAWYAHRAAHEAHHHLHAIEAGVLAGQ